MVGGSSALPTLEAFVKSYSAGPAGLLELSPPRDNLRTEYGREARTAQWLVTNPSFNLEEAKRILDAFDKSANVPNWTLTSLDGGRYVVCLGHGVECNLDGRDATDEAEDWLDAYAHLNMPGLSQEAVREHIEELRSADWEKTSLGKRSDWPAALRSAVATCLSAPFPVLLAWGKDLNST